MKNLISIVLLLLVANISTAQQVISIPGEQSVVNIPSNGDTMFGTMFTAEGPGPHPTILILHGMPGGSVLGAGATSGAGGLTLPLQSAGFNALIFNYRGAWGSGGKYSIKGRNEDVHAALAFLVSNSEKYKIDPTRISVVGHSFGGYNAIQAGIEDSTLLCTIGIAPLGRRSSSPSPSPEQELELDNAIRGLGGYTARDFRNQRLDIVDLRILMKGLSGRPLMIIELTQDTVIPKEVVLSYADAARSAGAAPFSYVEIDSDHNLRVDGSREELAKVVVGWLSENCN